MFRRISNLFRGFVGLFISGLEKRNPEALLEVEKENLRKQIAEYNQGLAAHAGLCEKLMAQVKKEEEHERNLKAKTKAHLQAGNQAAAAQYALRLQELQRNLAENRRQLQDAETTYKQLLKTRDVSIKAAKDKIEKLKYAIDDMKVKKATAELAEMASGMISQIGGSGDTLDRLHGMVEEERNRAAGRTRVAQDSLDTGEVDLMEKEQNALAQIALAEFAAQEGIQIAPAAPQVSAEEVAGSEEAPAAGQKESIKSMG